METNNPVRDGAQFVMSQSTQVEIIEESLSQFVEDVIDQYEFRLPSWDAPVFPTIGETSFETTVRFFLVTNALNYCFDDIKTGETYAIKFDGEVWEGAFGMFAAIRRAMSENIPILNPEFLQSITLQTVNEIFAPVSADRKMPLLESRVEQLRAIGDFMVSKPDFVANTFQEETPIYGENGAVETLASTPAYEDIRTYKGTQVRFDKRAQLFVSMLYGHLHGTAEEFTIPDIDSFTIFADYGIPAVLADNGVLSYSTELEASIRSGDEIAKDSEGEVGIRAATVVTGDRILEELHEKGYQSVTVPILDYILWQAHHEISFPTHRTSTTAY